MSVYLYVELIAMVTARNVFIANLAVSDLCLCIVTMPLTLIEVNSDSRSSRSSPPSMSCYQYMQETYHTTIHPHCTASAYNHNHPDYHCAALHEGCLPTLALGGELHSLPPSLTNPGAGSSTSISRWFSSTFDFPGCVHHHLLSLHLCDCNWPVSSPSHSTSEF